MKAKNHMMISLYLAIKKQARASARGQPPATLLYPIWGGFGKGDWRKDLR